MATALGETVGLEWAEVVPVSAVRGEQVGLLTDLLLARMRGRGALKGRLVLAEDWDSYDVNEAIADDFGVRS